MPLVYAGVCSHAPGIRGRKDLADPEVRDAFYGAFDGMRADLEASGAEAVIVIAAEHFANFFMNNMPSFAIGMADFYDGPIEIRVGSGSSGSGPLAIETCPSESSPR